MSVVIIVVACSYLLLNIFTDIELVKQAISKIPGYLYFILIGLSFLSYSARLARWLLFLRAMEPSIKIIKHTLIYFTGFALTLTPGKVGETIRSLYLYPLGICYSSSLAAFFSERLLDVLVVSILAFLTSFIFIDNAVFNTVVTIVIILLFLFIFLRSSLLNKLLMLFSKNRYIKNTQKFQGQVIVFLSNRSLLKSLPLSFSAWIIQGVILILIVNVFISDQSHIVIIGIYCLSILIGALSFIPGGVGSTEASIAFLLINIGLTPEQSVASAIVSRVVTLWLAIIIGIASLLIYSFLSKNNMRETDSVKN